MNGTMKMKHDRLLLYAVVIILLPVLWGCAPPARMGMVKNPDTGLQFGSIVDGSIITDASLFKNRKLKIRIRNTSGDINFNLKNFTEQLNSTYAAQGYEPTNDDDFGLMLNLNVLYSGQIQTNLSKEFAFLGGAAGGIAGYRSEVNAGTAIGAVGGATLGGIIGSFVTDDTYIIVASASFSIIKGPKKSEGKTITFSRSIPGKIEDEEERQERLKSRSIKRTVTNKIAVFAGGRNVRQSDIAREVRQRLIRIMGDII
jgi:hypothetical protein